MRLLVLVLLVASIFAVSSAKADEQAHRLQQIRVEGFELINSVLAFYNPNAEGMDYRFEKRYQQALTRLDALIVNPGPMLSALKQIRETLADLEENARNNPAYLYSRWVNPLLKAHAELDRAAVTQYEQSGASATLERKHEINLNLCRLLLLYQTRTFGTLGVFAMTMDEDTFTRLDASIVTGLELLAESHPDSREALSQLITQYAFVRPRLMQHGEKWVPGITAYYMGNISRDLAKLSF